ncbi:uncharacterized protein [Periplaneta americana]
MDLKPRAGRVLRVRGSLAVVLGFTLFLTFLSYSLLQGNVNIGRLLLNDEERQESVLEVVDSYLVWSPKCQIPNVHPFHESIRNYIKRGQPIVCSTKPPLTFTEWSSEDRYVLRFNGSAASHYGAHNHNLSCCYSAVMRVNGPTGNDYNNSADNYYHVGECSSFEDEVTLKPQEEFVLVKCFDLTQKGKKKEVYTNGHVVVPVKPIAKSKQETVASDGRRRPSVLLLGFDSMSRLNLLRTMPQTVRHLRERGWLELLGYNKVGENTLPNLAAILTGHSNEQLRKTCWPSSSKKFDNCTFIWKEFSQLGYVTVYAEDEPTSSTFNYHKTGFVEPPTDYYLRPFLLAAQNRMSVKKRDYMAICLGPTPTSEYLLRYVTDIVSVFKSALYFMLTWINNFSHSSSSTPTVMDDRVLQFFHELEDTGTLNSSLVVFLSDHGMRWGDIRKTSVGWLEERLPFIYIWVPEWFKEEHPEWYKNLEINKHRLSSPFDLHMTLRNLLEGSDNVTGCPGCPKCRSLFSELPADRSCEDAGITPNWCTCDKYRSMSTDDKTVRDVALFVLAEINSRVKKALNGSSVCAELAFNHVINMKRKIQVGPYDDYVVEFDTTPGGAVFEATVGRSNNVFQLKGSVSRINTYANQTECVEDAELKLYCHCN